MRKVTQKLTAIEKSVTFVLPLLLLILSFTNFSVETHNLPDESFRRLESGENSEEIVNQCCKREPKFISIGYGLDDAELRVDVGQCRHICEKSTIKPLKRGEFDRYLKKYPNMDPVQIFLALQSRVTPTTNSSVTNVNSNNNNGPLTTISIEQPEDEISSSSSSTLSATMSGSSSSCISSTCHPISTRREKHFGLGGGQQQEVDVIESCDCIKMPQECQRLPRPIRIHPDTPYERVIDIGQCLGSCDDTFDHSDLTCRPIRNRTVTIEGPNGDQCIQVIDECHCTGNCYRIREFFKVFDYSNVFSSLRSSSTNGTEDKDVTRPNRSNTETTNEVGVLPQQPTFSITNSEQPVTLQQLEPLTKVIDIGRCGGSCSDGHVTSKCLAWSSSGINSTCISALYGGRNKCSPKKFVTHSYTDKKGHQHTVISVISCGCH